MQDKTVIKNGSVLLPQGLKETDLELSGGIVSRIGTRISADTDATVIDADGKFVIPGFIDIHTNGIAGFDLTLGVYDRERDGFISDEEEYLDGLDNALREYALTGVTRAVLTSLASPVQDLEKVFRYVSAYRENYRARAWNGVLAGLYVEGTFMKEKGYRGAHNADYFNVPSKGLFDELQRAAGGLIKIVNVVPEWGAPALELIKYLTAKDIICAAGHTGATGSRYSMAIDHGTRLATHFLNGPTGSSVKPFDGGGATERVLRADQVFAEIIADGYHVDKAYVMDAIKRKGTDKVVVITDSMFPTMLEGLDKFSMLGVEGKVSSNGEYLQIADRGNALFGSTLTMDKAFSNILNWLTSPVEGIWNKLHEPLDFEEALLRASDMCSGNPARILGLFEPRVTNDNNDRSRHTGSIEAGKSADVLIADIEGTQGKRRVKIDMVFVNGQPASEQIANERKKRRIKN